MKLQFLVVNINGCVLLGIQMCGILKQAHAKQESSTFLAYTEQKVSNIG